MEVRIIETNILSFNNYRSLKIGLLSDLRNVSFYLMKKQKSKSDHPTVAVVCVFRARHVFDTF